MRGCGRIGRIRRSRRSNALEGTGPRTTRSIADSRSASLLAGRYAEGLDAVDKLVVKGAGDEPSLALALLVLYEGFEKKQPIQDVEQDRARMVRLSDSYRTIGGPSLALVNAWVAAATQKR